ncbi:glycoside hydrolase [Dentipellis sp. KUC8613]|nr:glycoside hydrolase [Dentipellis sp. KUC8613]
MSYARQGMRLFTFLFLLALHVSVLPRAAAFNMSRNDNLAVYWGQDSAGGQKPLSAYCADDTIDTLILAFLYVFDGPGGEPVIDLANTCSKSGSPVFPGTALADCSFMAQQIEACQARGKAVTLSLGGATGKVGFESDAAAEVFADRVWEQFLGGESAMRPFGKAVLDGVDLDIESGSSAHYAAFVNKIRAHAKRESKTKQYYITAAPQCPFPDEHLGGALDQAEFDAVYVQFYNNDCGLDEPENYNIDVWDTWARTKSPNKDVKIYIGAPSSEHAAGTGYVNAKTLGKHATDAQSSFDSFGGVMLWDASEATGEIPSSRWKAKSRSRY